MFKSHIQIFLITLLLVVVSYPISSQQKVHYNDDAMANIDYHHGALQSAIGVHNYQVMRANRTNINYSDGYGWTYNHAPDITYWNSKFYIQYLSDPVGEHIPPSQSLLVSSKDGKEWTKPEVIFPIYHIPDGTMKEGRSEVAKDLYAIMHQRMSFYNSDKGRLLALGYYGICMDKRDSPNDGKGIGRTVREIYKDGTFGPIYFIRYNKGWDEKNTHYPNYKSSSDREFVEICDDILADPLVMQQWNEEADRDDPLVPITQSFKAFNYYTLDDNRVVGFWKHALSSISDDSGKSWKRPERAFGFVNGNAKIWGQRTPDNKFVTIYNPSELRWPLALSVSDDGIEYKKLLLVHGEITPMRFGGNYKSYGPQYVRGIIEHNERPNDEKVWVSYSVNKEDIWISSIKTPIAWEETKDINDVFHKMKNGKELDYWNIYSPIWAPVKIEKQNGKKVLALYDKDPYDYAKAERVVSEAKKMSSTFNIIPAQKEGGYLEVEFTNIQGLGAIRLIFDNDGVLKLKNGYRINNIVEFEANKEYEIKVDIDVTTRFYTVFVNGEKKITRLVYRPVSSINKIVFRTGSENKFPNADTPTDQDYDLLEPNPDVPLKESIFYIKSFKTKKEE